MGSYGPFAYGPFVPSANGTSTSSSHQYFHGKNSTRMVLLRPRSVFFYRSLFACRFFFLSLFSKCQSFCLFFQEVPLLPATVHLNRVQVHRHSLLPRVTSKILTTLQFTIHKVRQLQPLVTTVKIPTCPRVDPLYLRLRVLTWPVRPVSFPAPVPHPHITHHLSILGRQVRWWCFNWSRSNTFIKKNIEWPNWHESYYIDYYITWETLH